MTWVMMLGSEQFQDAMAKDSDVPTRLLTEALARGEEEAWVAFFAGYEVRLKSYLRTCLRGSGDGVDDLFQELMLRVARYAKRFETEEAFWGWLTVVARSVLADHGRKKSAWGRFLDRYRGHVALEVGSGDVLGPRVDAAMAMLAVEDRNLLEGKYEQGLSVRLLAKELGVTEKAVERRLAKARKRFAKILKKLRKELES